MKHHRELGQSGRTIGWPIALAVATLGVGPGAKRDDVFKEWQDTCSAKARSWALKRETEESQ